MNAGELIQRFNEDTSTAPSAIIAINGLMGMAFKLMVDLTNMWRKGDIIVFCVDGSILTLVDDDEEEITLIRYGAFPDLPKEDDQFDTRKLRKVAEGLAILAKYGDEAGIAAEHDVIYAGPDFKDVSAEHAARLDELGWHNQEDSWAFWT